MVPSGVPFSVFPFPFFTEFHTRLGLLLPA